MNFVTITITRIRRLRKPDPLPQVDAVEARAWQDGYWQGMSIGGVCFFALGVLVSKFI